MSDQEFHTHHGQEEEARPSPVDTGTLWRRAARPGYLEAMNGPGAFAASLLAGFSLSTIGVLLTVDHPPKLANPAILALSGAATMLVYSMQVAFLALAHSQSAADWLAWYPEATVNRKSLEDVRVRQATGHECMVRYSRRYALTFQVGLLLFLAGLWLLAWPAWPGKGHFPIFRLLALTLVGITLLIELWWMAADFYNARPAGKRMPHPAGQGPDVVNVTVGAASPTGVAAVLDPGRRKAAKLYDYPDLSVGPGSHGR